MTNADIKMTGIRSVCSESKDLWLGSGLKLQVNYDPHDGSVWSDLLIGNEWNEYHDSEIVTCGYIFEPATQAEIGEMVSFGIKQREAEREYFVA